MPGAVYKKSTRRKAGAEDRNAGSAGGIMSVLENKGKAAANTRVTRPAARTAAAGQKTDGETGTVPEAPLKAYSARSPVTSPAPSSTTTGDNKPPARPRPADARQAARDRADVTPPADAGWLVRLTPSILVMLGMLLVVTLSFFFGFGLIVGRGSIPPGQPAPLESLLTEAADQEQESPERILPEEDLHFMTNLRAEGVNESDLLPAGDNPLVSQAMPPSASSTPSSGASAAAPAQAAPNVAPNAAPDDARYDFVLQVAAFRSESQADALRLRLEDAGMRTKLVRESIASGTLFHVQVLYRGNTENFQTLRDTLPGYGIRDSFLASKTPAP